MRRRRMSVVAGACALASGLSIALAPGASAYTSSRTSPSGGYGIAEISHTRAFYACDEGKADGYRVVAHLWPDGYSYRWVQDANGSGNSCGTSAQLTLPIGTDYTMRVCLRNGANGADVYCSSDERGTILT